MLLLVATYTTSYPLRWSCLQNADALSCGRLLVLTHRQTRCAAKIGAYAPVVVRALVVVQKAVPAHEHEVVVEHTLRSVVHGFTLQTLPHAP